MSAKRYDSSQLGASWSIRNGDLYIADQSQGSLEGVQANGADGVKVQTAGGRWNLKVPLLQEPILGDSAQGDAKLAAGARELLLTCVFCQPVFSRCSFPPAGSPAAGRSGQARQQRRRQEAQGERLAFSLRDRLRARCSRVLLPCRSLLSHPTTRPQRSRSQPATQACWSRCLSSAAQVCSCQSTGSRLRLPHPVPASVQRSAERARARRPPPSRSATGAEVAMRQARALPAQARAHHSFLVSA
jgi:hypothetical protein